MCTAFTEKGGNVPSITVSIPKELKQQMDELDEVNWSAVARSAFTEKLSEIHAIKEFKKNSTATQEDAVRLGRALKQSQSS